MEFAAFKNFVFIPSKTEGVAGTVYELEPSNAFEKNTFVLLPYKNPQKQTPVPHYYSIKNKFNVAAADLKIKTAQPVTLKATTSKQQYLHNVRQLKAHIQKGNIYEINYCIQFTAEHTAVDPLSIFLSLNALAKAPYAALVKLGNDFIISASPELFLEKKGGLIFSKPIKGTIKRGKTRQEDDALKHSLQTSLKERTENVMAVDVARNDLAQFAKKGTVQVNKLYNIETFETVHQMVSTVSCELKENTPFEKIIAASFPMASMTGAPKIRAMQLIDAFEDFERQSYSGAMGLVDENGDFSLSVIIRSIFYNQETKKLSISVGGAITYLSEAETEYDECLLKANALLKALNATIGE